MILSGSSSPINERLTLYGTSNLSIHYSSTRSGYNGVKLIADENHSEKDNLQSKIFEKTDLENNNANIPEEGIQDVTSFWIVCLVLFVGGMVQGIFFPTMLALCQKLKGDQVLLGYVTSSFSIGKIIMLPMFGSWSTTKGYKWTLKLSSGIILLGSIMMTQVLRVGQQWFLVLSNTVLGVGSGTLAVARAYTSEVTCTDERTGYMALISAVQYSGMTVTPLFGSLFTYIRELYHEDEDETTSFLNKFSSPAILMTATSFITLYFLSVHFNDTPRICSVGDGFLLTPSETSIGDKNPDKQFVSHLSAIKSSLIGLFMLNLFVKGTMSCYEAFGIDFAETRFNLKDSETGAIVSVCGFCGALLLVVIRMLSAGKMSDVQIIITGYCLYILGVILNIFLKDDADLNPTWLYALSIFCIYAIGYPACHVGLIGLFSKVAGKRPQGKLFGFLSMTGSIARATFPIASSYIVVYDGFQTVFVILSSCLIASLVYVIIYRKTFTELSHN